MQILILKKDENLIYKGILILKASWEKNCRVIVQLMVNKY